MRSFKEVAETARENLAFDEKLKATNHLYRALRHAAKSNPSSQERARLHEFAEFAKEHIVYDLTLGEQAICLFVVLIVIEALLLGVIIALSTLFPTLNSVSDLAIGLSLLILSLLVITPAVYLTVKPDGFLYKIAEWRAKRREQWLHTLYQNTAEVHRLATAPTIRVSYKHD